MTIFTQLPSIFSTECWKCKQINYRSKSFIARCNGVMSNHTFRWRHDKKISFGIICKTAVLKIYMGTGAEWGTPSWLLSPPSLPVHKLYIDLRCLLWTVAIGFHLVKVRIRNNWAQDHEYKWKLICAHERKLEVFISSNVFLNYTLFAQLEKTCVCL